MVAKKKQTLKSVKKITKKKELAPQEKAVAVAKDVIKRLKYLNIETRHYMCGQIPSKLKISEKDDLKKHVAKVEKYCKVCALGACIISKARLFDEVPMISLVGGD